MHILIAPNAFKNSLPATQVAGAIQYGLNQSKLKFTSVIFPVADGGDGTGSLIVEHLKGATINVKVNGPLGREITTSFGLIDEGKTAVIEMADASGLRLLKQDELDPLQASSYGTGQLITAALDKGVSKIMIAMGGSATVDGGCGILSALGFKFLDADGQILKAVPERLQNVVKVDGTSADKRLQNCELVVLCDVDNRLLGQNGAAAVFGPQKGADETAVKKLEAFLTQLNQVAIKQGAKDMDSLTYGGTAGGAAAGLHTFMNARLVSGIEFLLNITDFNSELKKADLLITGEGSIDTQTLQGKAPFGVAKRAIEADIPTIAVAGKVPVNPDKDLLKYFNVLLPIGNAPGNLTDAFQYTHENLIRTATQIGNILSLRTRN